MAVLVFTMESLLQSEAIRFELKFDPWSVCISAGKPNLVKTCVMRQSAITAACVDGSAIASGQREKWSVTTRIYLLPDFVCGSGPKMSMLIR